MLYLVTGTNGAGKTLFTLKWVMELAQKSGRPVAHNGRFEPFPDGPLKDWKKIDFKDWQKEPDGTIFLIDECHNDMPVRPASQKPSEAITMLAEHRRRGMDFFLITQHPQNIDTFVRRLIGSPGWHRHLKRTFGGETVSVCEWDAVNPQCERPGSGKDGEVSIKAFPKEVFSWYRSASIHTAKKKIPKAVFVLGACVLALPLCLYMGYSAITSNSTKAAEKEKPNETQQIQQAKPTAPAQIRTVSTGPQPITTAEYVARYTPRIPDFPHSAPIYDEVTKPVQAPYPAACIQSKDKCKCYSQQGTYLPSVGADVCAQIVANGFFIDWQQPQQMQQQLAISDKPHQAGQQQNRSAEPVVVPRSEDEPRLLAMDFSEGLAHRNSQVRSQIEAAK